MATSLETTNNQFIREEPTYKYSEKRILEEVKKHIDSTYSGHYADEIQTTEYIMSRAKTLDFLSGNIFKYTDRFGKKEGYNPLDIYKAIHYLIIAAHYAEKKFK